MEFSLQKDTNISITHRYGEIILDIEDVRYTLEEDLLRTIFEASGTKHLKNTLCDDMFRELLDERQEELHNYLIESGYIFNKE